MNIVDFCFCTVCTKCVNVAVLYNLYALKRKPWLRSNSDSKSFYCAIAVHTVQQQYSGVQGGEQGDGPGHPRQGDIQGVKLQKVKGCNLMIFYIVRLLTHPAWI